MIHKKKRTFHKDLGQKATKKTPGKRGTKKSEKKWIVFLPGSKGAVKREKSP